MIKLSQTSKLDGIRSWSLEAGSTCPFSLDKEGNPVPACAICYAKGGNYRFKNVKEVREVNREGWKASEWVDQMVDLLDSDRYFRWFDSGDIYHPKLALKILEVMQRTPWVKHWLPTRAYKSDKIRPVLEVMKSLPNVTVRYSSDSIDGTYTKGLHGSVIVPHADSKVSDDVVVCQAYDRGGKCQGCRLCWNEKDKVIGYVAHGQKAKRVIKIMAL